MGIRPAKCMREPQGQLWARISRRKPRKSYVKGAPNPKVRQYTHGNDKYYDVEVRLTATAPIHLRDNAIEAARQAINKYMERQLMAENYYLQVLKYPHLVIREHSALGVAGADRISKGMKRAFGKPRGRMLRLDIGEAIYLVRCAAKDISVAKAALKRGRLKLSGQYSYDVTDISKQTWNTAKGTQGRMSKKTIKAQEEAAKAAAEAALGAGAAAPAAGATPAAGAKPGAPAAPAAKAAPAKK